MLEQWCELQEVQVPTEEEAVVVQQEAGYIEEKMN